MTDFHKWWVPYWNLSEDRYGPSPKNAANAAWEEQQKRITELKALADPLTRALYNEMRISHKAIVLEKKELKARVEELRTKKNFFRDKMTNKIGEIEKLQARVEQLEAENEALRETISDVLQTMPPCGERVSLQLALNPDLMMPQEPKA